MGVWCGGGDVGVVVATRGGDFQKDGTLVFSRSTPWSAAGVTRRTHHGRGQHEGRDEEEENSPHCKRLFTLQGEERRKVEAWGRRGGVLCERGVWSCREGVAPV